jgi:hypothetical protein
VKPLEQAAFRQRHDSPIADDEMIEQPDVHQCQRLLDALGNELVRLAGLGDA